MSETKTHWKQLINPAYLGAYSLPNGEDMNVTIDRVGREPVTTVGGKTEECTVARIINSKPLILNATNSKAIAKIYGPYIENWAGKNITLFAATTKFAGDIVECIRVRPQAPIQTKENISNDRLSKAIQSIKDGTYTKEKLIKKFDLTSDQLAMLGDEYAD